MKKVLASLSLAALSVGGIACEPAARTIDPGQSPVSGAIAVTRDNEHILIADEDRDQLLVLDRVSKAIQSRVSVGDAPGHVVELSNGTAAVTTRYGNSLVVVDVAGGAVLQTIAVGSEPYGLTELADGRVAVVLAGEAAVALVDVDAGVVTKKTQLTDPDPRAIAVVGDTLYVTHMATGAFSKLPIDGDVPTRLDVSTRNDFGPRVIPEHLRSLTVDQDTGSILVAHSQANSETVRSPIDEPGLPEGGECSGYGGCPATLGAVVPGLTELDTTSDSVLVPQPGSNQANPNQGFDDCFDCGQFPGGGFGFAPNPPSILNPFDGRFAIGNGKPLELANPTALALFDGGRGQILVNLSSKNALLLKRHLNGTASDVIASVKLGNGAQSIALSQDGAVAYVWNQFDMTLSEIALPQVDDGIDTASKFVPDAQGNPVADAELSIVPELAANTVALGLTDALDAEASAGRIMFHNATDSRISANATVACASCHPDGRNDGRTWLFVFGPRNTPQLGGDILDTAPFHWPGDVTSVADLNRMTVLPFMGGSGLDPGSFEYVAKFIGTIRAAPSVVTVGGLNERELRGEEIFNRTDTQCSTCHAGGHFTDNIAYDVNTKSNDSRFTDISRFQTPVLHGLNRSGPYLHDGTQKTLEDLVENIVATDKMGKGSHLSLDEKADLVAYLKTL